MSVYKTVCKKIRNIPFGFLVGSHFWQPWAFNRVSVYLSVALLLSPVTHCDSLIRSVLSFFETKQPVIHITDTVTEKPNIRDSWVLFLTVRCPQSVNEPWIKGRKQRTQKASDVFCFLFKVPRLKLKNVVSLLKWSLEGPLTDTLQSVKAEMRWEVLTKTEKLVSACSATSVHSKKK